MAKVQRPSARPSLNELAKIINQLRVALDGVSRVVEKTNSSVASLEETVGTGETVWNPPPAPVNLVVSGAFNTIFLTWAGAEFAGYSHTEIYRADTDNLSEAVLIGTSYALVYSDTPPNSSLSKTYYYWIRFANRNDPPTFGPFNAAAGTPGSTADDPSYLLELLFERLGYEQFDSASGVFPVRVVDVLPALPDVKWPKGSAAYLTTDGKLYRTDGTTWDAGVSTEDIVGKLTAGQIAAGAIVAEHIGTNEVIANSANIKDGVIVNAKIANLAVDNAKISDLSVAKLLAGVISAAGIYLGAGQRVHLDGQNQRIDVRDTNNTLRVRLGNLGTGWGLEIYNSAGQTILNSGGVPYSAVDGGPSADADNTDRYLDTVNPNMLKNPNAVLGTSFWNNTQNFGIYYNRGTGERHWYMTASVATTKTADSDFIPANQNTVYTLSAEMYVSGLTQGGWYCDTLYFDSNKNVIGEGPQVGLTSDSSWVRLSDTGTSPAGTAYITVRFFLGNAITPDASIRKIKLEGGSVATRFVGEEYGSDVTADNTANDTARVAGTAASTVRDNASAGATFTSSQAGLFAYTNLIDPTNRSDLLALKVIGGAFIDDAAVNTLHIQNNAVTVPVSAFTSDIINAGTSETLVQSVAINSEGQPVIITASYIQKAGGSSGAIGGYVYLYRGSTLIYTSISIGGFSGYEFYEAMNSFTIKDNPVGATTYYLKIRGINRVQYISKICLTALGVMR